MVIFEVENEPLLDDLQRGTDPVRALVGFIIQLVHCALELQDAQATHAGAVVAQAEAKRALEIARAHLLCQGVEGKNAEQRDAVIRLELNDLYQALAQAEMALSEARCELECARIDWDVARYSVKALEVAA